MKKHIAFCFVIVLLISLCSCGGVSSKTTGEVPSETTHRIGETVSTDIIDFTLNSAQFALYADSSAWSSGDAPNYMKPTTEPQDFFVASTGHSFVALTFTINNKDRGTLNVCNIFNDGWEMRMTAKYKGEKYTLQGFDLNDKNGSGRMSLAWSAISTDGGKNFTKYKSSNYLLYAGEPPITVRTIGVIPVEPENLSDSFELTIDVLNSSGKTESFTYRIG